MSFVLQPWQLFLLILASWINRQQHEVVEYLRTANQVLKEKLGKQRILLSDNQRRRLAVRGKILGRQRLVMRSGLIGTQSGGVCLDSVRRIPAAWAAQPRL